MPIFLALIFFILSGKNFLVQALNYPEVYINEFHPNPTEGSEWIEIACSDQAVENEFSLDGFQIFDSFHLIYPFNEVKCLEKYLVVEVSGLNNDLDQVILKDNNSQILETIDYKNSLKGISFLRLSPYESIFILGEASKGEENIFLSPSPSVTPIPSQVISPKQTLSPTLGSPVVKQEEEKGEKTSLTEIEKEGPQKQKKSFLYPQQEIKTDIDWQQFPKRKSRLVFIQQTISKEKVQNAIMGSFLIYLGGGILFFYAKT